MVFTSAYIVSAVQCPLLTRDLLISLVGVMVLSFHWMTLEFQRYFYTATWILNEINFNSASYITTFAILPFFKSLNFVVLTYVIQNKTIFYYLIVACAFDINLSVVNNKFTTINIITIVLYSIVIVVIGYGVLCRQQQLKQKVKEEEKEEA